MKAYPFFRASDSLGFHAYFRSLESAEAFQREVGGYIRETTQGRIWRVTTEGPVHWIDK